VRARRFIPTCVGWMSTNARADSGAETVHPHVRGVDDRVYGKYISDKPVHPHVRGVDGDGCGCRGCRCRFIPTCVGWMAYGRARRGEEKRFIPTCVGWISGESVPDYESTRFIPTCVGWIQFLPLCRPPVNGSSPRAWGGCQTARRSSGLSSVHPHVRGVDASYLTMLSPSFSVHPHVRGVDSIPCCLDESGSAVHPHVRGVDVNDLAERLDLLDRFIPTCVGWIFAMAVSCEALIGSSPRAWGGCAHYWIFRDNCGGSSPRAWGGY